MDKFNLDLPKRLTDKLRKVGFPGMTITFSCPCRSKVTEWMMSTDEVVTLFRHGILDP